MDTIITRSNDGGVVETPIKEWLEKKILNKKKTKIKQAKEKDDLIEICEHFDKIFAKEEYEGKSEEELTELILKKLSIEKLATFFDIGVHTNSYIDMFNITYHQFNCLVKAGFITPIKFELYNCRKVKTYDIEQYEKMTKEYIDKIIEEYHISEEIEYNDENEHEIDTNLYREIVCNIKDKRPHEERYRDYLIKSYEDIKKYRNDEAEEFDDNVDASILDKSHMIDTDGSITPLQD